MNYFQLFCANSTGNLVNSLFGVKVLNPFCSFASSFSSSSFSTYMIVISAISCFLSPFSVYHLILPRLTIHHSYNLHVLSFQASICYPAASFYHPIIHHIHHNILRIVSGCILHLFFFFNLFNFVGFIFLFFLIFLNPNNIYIKQVYKS